MDKNKSDKYADGGIITQENLLFFRQCDYSMESEMMKNIMKNDNKNSYQKISEKIIQSISDAINNISISDFSVQNNPILTDVKNGYAVYSPSKKITIIIKGTIQGDDNGKRT